MSWMVGRQLCGSAALVLALAAFSGACSVAAQESAPRSASQQHETDGIAVTSDLVRRRCGSCHPADDKGRMTRISYRRTTPEGWQETIRRMVALNNVQLSPEEGRDIVRYLATTHGLAPEELQPGAFEVERRLIDYRYEADAETEETCTKCHSMGRILLQRRTRQEWELLIATHRGLYPLVDTQAFRRTGRSDRDRPTDGRPPDTRHPMDKAIAHLAEAFPLRTPVWAAWSATMRPPALQGRWALTGHVPGKGPIYGEVTIGQTASGSNDGGDVSTEVRYVVARSGERVERRGQAVIYAGFQWRGRSMEAGGASALREVMVVDRGWRRMTGRWFMGAYDEIGQDVVLERLGTAPVLLGADVQRLRAGATGQRIRLFGANLPEPAPADIDFGPGVTVERVVEATPTVITVDVAVQAAAPVGARDVFVGHASAQAAVAVYERMDGIRITPRAGLARVGGVTFPKQLQQFEATAFTNGPDGKPDTADDVRLGLVDATWSLEEYTATYHDDDRKFVGAIDPATGLFTPNVDGPNPDRRNSANNYGDVWVVATYTPADTKPAAAPLRARAHLLVTVPLYMRWEPVEASR